MTSVSRKERAYEKYAWVIFFVFGFATFISAPIVLLGRPPDPPSAQSTTGLTLDEIAARTPGILGYIGGITTQLGNFMLATGVLTMGIALVPYRRGERWAWYVSWVLPVLLVVQLANSLSTGARLWQVDFVGLLVILAGLFMPYRKFFPKVTR